jgi:hypothetical protein
MLWVSLTIYNQHFIAKANARGNAMVENQAKAIINLDIATLLFWHPLKESNPHHQFWRLR